MKLAHYNVDFGNYDGQIYLCWKILLSKEVFVLNFDYNFDYNYWPEDEVWIFCNQVTYLFPRLQLSTKSCYHTQVVLIL